jgi:hypothetical protein
MTRLRMAAVGALITLGGCDMIAGLAGADGDNNVSAANESEAAANRTAAVDNARAAADAGVTSSRSLSGLTGGAGDKDPAAVMAGSGATIDPQQLHGTWSDQEDCKIPIVFNPDGSFTSPTANGRWSVDGGVLTMARTDGSTSMRILSIEPNAVTVQHPDGSTGRSRRC